MPVPSHTEHVQLSPSENPVPSPSQAGHFCSAWTGASRCSATRSCSFNNNASMNFFASDNVLKPYFVALLPGFLVVIIIIMIFLSKSRTTGFHPAPRSSTKPPAFWGSAASTNGLRKRLTLCAHNTERRTRPFRLCPTRGNSPLHAFVGRTLIAPNTQASKPFSLPRHHQKQVSSNNPYHKQRNHL